MAINTSRLSTALLDRVGVLLSAVCLVHCLAVPLFVTIVPLVGSTLLSDQAFHWLLLVLILPTSLWALLSGCSRHGHRAVGATGAVGLAILIAVAILGHDVFGEAGERLATSLGSVVVGIAHLMNYRRVRASGELQRN